MTKVANHNNNSQAAMDLEQQDPAEEDPTMNDEEEETTTVDPFIGIDIDTSKRPGDENYVRQEKPTTSHNNAMEETRSYCWVWVLLVALSLVCLGLGVYFGTSGSKDQDGAFEVQAEWKTVVQHCGDPSCWEDPIIFTASQQMDIGESVRYSYIANELNNGTRIILETTLTGVQGYLEDSAMAFFAVSMTVEGVCTQNQTTAAMVGSGDWGAWSLEMHSCGVSKDEILIASQGRAKISSTRKDAWMID